MCAVYGILPLRAVEMEMTDLFASLGFIPRSSGEGVRGVCECSDIEIL